MTQPVHTPGAIKISEEFGLYSDDHGTITNARNGAEYDDGSDPATIEISKPDARLLAAAYNAFDSAAKRLGCNAVESAEGMQDGAIYDLMEALKLALHYKGGWREAIVELEDYCSGPVRLKNMLAAADQLDAFASKARAVLAKAKGRRGMTDNREVLINAMLNAHERNGGMPSTYATFDRHNRSYWEDIADAARDHYAPKLTEKEAVELLTDTPYPIGKTGKCVISMRPAQADFLISALRAASVRFKEEG